MMMSRWRRFEQRVRDEESVLLTNSPMYRAFSTLIELTRAAGQLSEARDKNHVERCVNHLLFCLRIIETQQKDLQIVLA